MPGATFSPHNTPPDNKYSPSIYGTINIPPPYMMALYWGRGVIGGQLIVGEGARDYVGVYNANM